MSTENTSKPLLFPEKFAKITSLGNYKLYLLMQKRNYVPVHKSTET